MVCACANAGAEAENALRIPLKSPRLWNGLEDPYLYTARVALLEADAAIDALEIPFGVRTFYVDPELGFFLNGKPYPAARRIAPSMP
jgi:beta-galactosidase